MTDTTRMSHTHTCPDCDVTYPGAGSVFETDDRGSLGCDCLRKERCEACEPSCGLCEAEGVYTKASTENAQGEPRCENCHDREAERVSGACEGK